MIRLPTKPLALAMVLAFSPYLPAVAAEESLCQRLGWAENVAAIAADFGDRMRQDTPDKLGRFWLHRGTDGINRERQLAVQFFQNAARCGPIYQGRNMEKAHRGMGLSARDWDRAFNFFRLAVWAHVKDEATRVEFLALIGKTRGAIVDYQSRHYGCSQPKD